MDPLAQAAQALAAAAAALASAAAKLGQGRPDCPQAPAALSPAHSPTVARAINEFLLAKARAGRSETYLKTLRVTLSAFARGIESFPVSAVSPRHVETWADRRFRNPKTRRGYMADVRTFFNWIHRRGIIAHNPAAAVELPSAPPAPARIHTPAQAQAVLELSRRIHPDLALFCALRYFAGLRSSEALRLAPEDIGAEFLTVQASKSKTRRRRVIAIAPNLKAWIALGGEVPLRDPHSKIFALGQAARAAGIPMMKNTARHSFCSYRLAQAQDAAAVALEAGHSEEMLFRQYRELVSADAAAAWFAITPECMSSL